MKTNNKSNSISKTIWLLPLATFATLLFFPSQSILADDFVWELFAPSTNWDNVASWAGTPNQVPDDNTDSATVTVDSGSGVAPVLVANRVIGALTLSGNGDVDTGGFALTVQESLFQDGTTVIEDSNSTLTVRPSLVFNDFDTDNLIINSGGDLRLRDGARVQVDAILDNNAGGLIFGEGILEINGADNFDNNGQIQAFSGILQVQDTGAAAIDLDGSLEDGILISRDNTMLVIDIPLTGPFFDGQVRILGGEVQINDNWILNSTGGTFLEFDAGFDGGTTATLSGTGFTLSGEANIVSETAVLAAPTTVTGTATLDIADDTTLQFDAPTAVVNADSIVNGFSTTLIVNDDVDIGNGANAGNFNWDGFGQDGVVDGRTIVNSDAALNINVGSIDEPGLDERYSGRITINSGSISVQNASGQWEHSGRFDFNNTAGLTPELSGEPVVMFGLVDVGGNGLSQILASATMASSSQVDVSNNANLRFNGANLVINGGEWTGSGEVDLDAAFTTVTAATTVNMPNGTFDLDGTFVNDTVALNAPLTLNVDALDTNVPNNQICNTVQINSAGRLDVNFSDEGTSYIFDGTLDLNALGGNLASLHLDGDDVELAGSTDVSGNSISDARTDLTGFMNLNVGSSFNFGGGSVANPNRIFDTATFAGSGDLVVAFDAALQVEDSALVAADVENSGYFEPGFSIGDIDVLGNYRQLASGTLTIELTQGFNMVQHDLLAAVGLANLNGTLRIKLIDQGNGIPVLNVGDEFTIVTAGGGMVNQFDNVPDSIGDGEGYEWDVIYGANDVTIRVASVIPNLVLGDVNGDGIVSLLDVDPFVEAIESGDYVIQADINCDGEVNLLDVSLFVALLSG